MRKVQIEFPMSRAIAWRLFRVASANLTCLMSQFRISRYSLSRNYTLLLSHASLKGSSDKQALMSSTLKRVSSGERSISPPPSKRNKVAEGAASSSVNNFFKPVSQKERQPGSVKFQVVQDSVLVARHDDAHKLQRNKPVKIAAFDFDDTLIATKSGNRFAKGSDDWKWWHHSVPTKLKQLHSDGYCIVVLSNQGGISLRSDSKTAKGDMKSLTNFKGKVTQVLNSLNLPVSVYAATGQDKYRKPRGGMWDQLLKDYGLSDEGDVLHETTLFVGDAAGREGDKKKGVKKDHSCSDRDFAVNVGIPFMTPEEFFLNEPEKPFKRRFDPNNYLDLVLESTKDAMPDKSFTKNHDVELVLFCGSPGAGKSTFYWQIMQPLQYERVNQDSLKTRDKCMKVATQFVEDQKSVVVDNTNADTETRAAWVGLAKRLGVPVRLVHFTAPAELCEHNDTVRAMNGTLVR